MCNVAPFFEEVFQWPNNECQKNYYDNKGNIIKTVTSKNDYWNEKYYDENGRVIKYKDSYGIEFKIHYDENGDYKYEVINGKIEI